MEAVYTYIRETDLQGTFEEQVANNFLNIYFRMKRCSGKVCVVVNVVDVFDTLHCSGCKIYKNKFET